MQIYVAKDNKTTGPYSIEQINANVQAGLFEDKDMCWYEGIPGWIPISALNQRTLEPPTLPPPNDQIQPVKQTAGSMFRGNRKWKPVELGIIFTLAVLFPPAGLLFGILGTVNPQKRKQGKMLLCITLLFLPFTVISATKR